MNPYEVTGQEPPPQSWFSPVTAIVLLTMLVGMIGLYFWTGVDGLALGAYFSALVWFSLSRTSHPAFRPISNNRMTLVELTVILAILGILYGLTLPAVTSQPRRRLIQTEIQSPQ